MNKPTVFDHLEAPKCVAGPPEKLCEAPGWRPGTAAPRSPLHLLGGAGGPTHLAAGGWDNQPWWLVNGWFMAGG